MTFYIQNVESGLVLDVKEAKEALGTEIVLFRYLGQNNQHWRYHDNLIHSQMNGMVIDVSAKTGNLIIYRAHGGPNQQWTFEEDSTITSGDGKVMDVKGGKAVQGKNILTYKKHGKPSQRWKQVFVAVPFVNQ